MRGGDETDGVNGVGGMGGAGGIGGAEGAGGADGVASANGVGGANCVRGDGIGGAEGVGGAGGMGGANGVGGADGVGGANGAPGANGMNGADGAGGAGGARGADGKAEQGMTRGDGMYGDGGTLGGGLTHTSALERDIALLLADAADEVEIGIAPYQAVVRGGRRRRARRWAVAATVAVALVGCTGALALTGVTDDGRRAETLAATPPTTAEKRHVYEPQRTELASGRDQGVDWKVAVDVWAAPRNAEEAEKQYAAMALYGYKPTDVDRAADLVGRSWHFAHLTLGGDQAGAVIDGEEWTASGTDMQTFAMVLRTGDWEKGGSPKRLVIGEVAPTAQQVRVTWSDGTSVEVNREADLAWYADLRNPRIVDAKGSPVSWFVALAPEGVGYESAKVTK